METATISDVLARIDREAARVPGGAIATDGDGTLWSGDIGEDFFAALVESNRILAAAHDPLVREAKAENVDASGTACEVAHRIHAAYLAGTFPEERVCEIMTWAVAGARREDVDAFAREVVAAVHLATRLHGEALRVIDHAKSRGIEVHLVSASPRPIVLAAASLVGIDPAHVTCAMDRYDGAGVALAECDLPIPYGPGKVKRLREKLGADRVLYAAMGDNAFDVALLREARVPVAIRPKARLVERAAEVPGLAILEKV